MMWPRKSAASSSKSCAHTYPKQVSVWKSLCPDPNFLFKNRNLVTEYDSTTDEILDYRKTHLGKGLSLSYHEPLYILRGDGVYLLDPFGRKYLDTVNNVAHVGHEHPKVVVAGQKQMALLNTNTRYLNEEINRYTARLLKKLPEKLSVLHFVNSGSEANELAIRIAKVTTGRNDMLVLKNGYHGNTNAVIDVSSYKFDGKGGKGKSNNTHILPMPDPYRGIYEGDNSGAKYASHAKEIIDEQNSIARPRPFQPRMKKATRHGPSPVRGYFPHRHATQAPSTARNSCTMRCM